ncbi:unnamed protein product, partial [Musa acuminata subsp. burmannicoides]
EHQKEKRYQAASMKKLVQSLHRFCKEQEDCLFEEPIKNHSVAIFTSSMQAQIWVGHRSYFIRGFRYRIHTPSDRFEVRTHM